MYRERERCIYVYIYIERERDTYIYIYIERERYMCYCLIRGYVSYSVLMLLTYTIEVKQRPTRQWHRGKGVSERNRGS